MMGQFDASDRPLGREVRAHQPFVKMNRTKLPLLAASGAALLFAGCAQASALSDALEAVIDTTPAGLAKSSASRPGDWASFWSDTKEGARYIMENGSDLWVVPTFTNHPAWNWEDRSEENAYPFGMGLARQVIDDRGNERMFFLVSFVDSNYRVEPMVGYSWVARWPIGNTGLHWGAGYLAGITMRGDYMWLPCPLPLPVVKVGTDTVSFYTTYIPFTNVFFMYTSIAIDNAGSRKMPLSAESPWVKTPNLLYGSWGWRYVDNGEEESPNTVKNDSVWGVGLRHYSGCSWQTDLRYKKGSHDVKVPGSKDMSLDIETYSLTIAYNIDVAQTFRLFAGGGFGVSHAESDAGSDWDVHPALTMGFTWAATDLIHITGSMDTNISRFKGVVDGRDNDYVLKGMPTEFTLSVGLAF